MALGKACGQRPIKTMLGQFFFLAFFLGTQLGWAKNLIGPSCLWKGLETEAYKNHVKPFFFLAFFWGLVGDGQKTL